MLFLRKIPLLYLWHHRVIHGINTIKGSFLSDRDIKTESKTIGTYIKVDYDSKDKDLYWDKMFFTSIIVSRDGNIPNCIQLFLWHQLPHHLKQPFHFYKNKNL